MEIYTSTESHFQAANDHVYSMLWGVEAMVGLFRCECNRPFCSEEVLMSREAYARLRDRADLVYAPGHEGSSLHDQANA